MIQTLLVYFITTSFLFVGASLRSKTSVFGIPGLLFLALLFYTFVFGVRFGVGTDYHAYLDAYQYIKNFGSLSENGEFGFNLMTHFFANNSFHFSIYFGFIAFVQILFLTKAFLNEGKLLSFIFLSFMLTCAFLSWMNGLRQIIALSIFIYSIDFILSKRWNRYFLAIAIASLFHTSAVILFPLYFLRNAKNYIPPVKIQLLLLILALSISGKYNTDIFGYLPGFVDQLGYSHYETYANNPAELKIGIGYFIILAINLLIILLSSKIIDIYNDRKFEFIYFLFFVGCLWNYVFMGSIPLNRVNYYFYGLNFLVVGYYLNMYYILRKNKKFEILFFAFLTLILLLFVGFLTSYEENTMKYVFYWENIID